MKKVLLLLFLFVFLGPLVEASTSEIVNGVSIMEAQNRIDKIGFRILNSNGIEHRMVFDYNTKNTKNIFQNY